METGELVDNKKLNMRIGSFISHFIFSILILFTGLCYFLSIYLVGDLYFFLLRRLEYLFGVGPCIDLLLR